MFLGDRQQLGDRTADFLIRRGCFVGSLEAQLQACDVAGRERGIQRRSKRRQLFGREIGGADQVQAATQVAVPCPVCGPGPQRICIGRAQNLP